MVIYYKPRLVDLFDTANMHLSRRKGRLTEQQASVKKFLDRSKESIKRLKALKFGLGKCEVY